MEALFTFTKWKMQEWNRHFKKKSMGKTNYTHWELDLKAEFLCVLEWVVIEGMFAYFFYRSYLAMIVLAPGIYFYRKEKIKSLILKRKNNLEQQFKETLLSVQTNLQSGYSVENAFLESRSYIVEIYGDTCDMAMELFWIQKGLSNGDTLEHLLWNLGRRCPGSALEEFADIYSIACKMGNGWSEIITKIITGINQRMETKEEIEILIHGRKVECRIMYVIPFFLLFYMNLTSKGYFDVLYHNPAGIIIMSVCLAGYVLAIFISEKITRI